MKRDVLEVHRPDTGDASTVRAGDPDDDSGQDLIEYGLLAAVISVGFVGTIQAVAAGVVPLFDRVLAAF